MSENEQGPVWKVNPRVRFRRVFDEGVVIHQERAEALVLNDAAMAFLELCDGRRNLKEIRNLLLEQFDVEAEILNSDLGTFVAQLIDEGLIKPLEDQ